MIRLKCGIEVAEESIQALLNASNDSVMWQEEQLPPAPGMEEVEETVGWPAVIAGFPMPAERIAFYRKVLDLRDSQVCYGVESLAEAVGPGKSTFERKDFQVLSCDGTLAGARNVVLVEIKRFLLENL